MTSRTLVTVDALWAGDRFLGPTVLELSGETLHRAQNSTHAERAPTPTDHKIRLGGTVFPVLTDHHVHLGLADAPELFAGGITYAVDLGWSPAAASWLADQPGRPAVSIAGALITAPGGYPVQAGWAPPGAACEVGGPRAARAAVREQIMLGASRIKVALNTQAGTTVDNPTLDAIVEEATEAGLPVIAHVQGEGQTARAVLAGVAQLAHVPFTERIPDALLNTAARAGMTWITTLDIHGWGQPTPEQGIAIDNLRRFTESGGTARYGTDLGNGPLPMGVNPRELAGMRAAGMPPISILEAVAGDALPDVIGPRFAWLPSPPPVDLNADLPGWLARARGRDLRLPAWHEPHRPMPLDATGNA